jgi:hypothetical protein
MTDSDRLERIEALIESNAKAIAALTDTFNRRTKEDSYFNSPVESFGPVSKPSLPPISSKYSVASKPQNANSERENWQRLSEIDRHLDRLEERIETIYSRFVLIIYILSAFLVITIGFIAFSSQLIH